MKKTHLENLKDHTPDLMDLSIIDIGSGKGKFLVEAVQKGVKAVGLELNPEYINLTKDLANKSGVEVNVTQGVGESMPFNGSSFGFANMCELIEHVNDPKKVLSETYRILSPGGRAYMSVPNRFGFYDPHFHLYFVNYLPRFLSDYFIAVFGRHKKYNYDAGRQKLTEMHYFTFGQIKKLSESVGFEVVDIRAEKIKKKFKKPLQYLVMAIYFVARALYFNTSHVLLIKKS